MAKYIEAAEASEREARARLTDEMAKCEPA